MATSKYPKYTHAANAYFQDRHVARLTKLDEFYDCTCVFSCADDPDTACSLSGQWHVHPDDGSGCFGACPVHPDAPGDL